MSGLIIIAALYVYWAGLFVRAEHTIWGWDFSGFWRLSAGLVALEKHSIGRAILGFGLSMRFDYNDLTLLPSALVMAIWGTSRFCYVIANAIFLNIPSALLCLGLLVRINAATWAHAAFALLAFLALVAAPLPWMVTLTGMSDVGGLIMAAVATSLAMRTELRSKDTIRWLALGAALALTALSKRWYLYFVIGMLATLLADAALILISTIRRDRSITLSSIIDVAYGPFLCGCAVVAVYFLSYPLPLASLTNNYSVIYSAYQTGGGWAGDLRTNFGSIIERFGPAQSALTVLCLAAALCWERTRRSAVYLFVPAVVAGIDFSKVQTLDDHHTLLFYIAIMVTPLFFAQQLLSLDFPPAKSWGWAIVVLAAVISCLGYSSIFSPSPPFGASMVQSAFPDERMLPEQRHDLDALAALMQFIGPKVVEPGQPPQQGNVYLLASSHLLNSTHLASAGFQLNQPLPAQDYVSVTHDVDLRDGFPEALVTAKVVVLAEPLQTHLRGEQKVLAVPFRMFTQGQSFAQAFTRDPQTFQFDDGVRVSVFERARPSTPEEIADLHQQINLPSIQY